MEALFISGFAGALAGGFTSLVSQYINRRWDRSDVNKAHKIKIYTEILSPGGQSIEKFRELNNRVSAARLYSEPELTALLESLMHEIAFFLREVDKLETEEAKNNFRSTTITKIRNIHKDCLSAMKTELNLK